MSSTDATTINNPPGCLLVPSLQLYDWAAHPVVRLRRVEHLRIPSGYLPPRNEQYEYIKTADPNEHPEYVRTDNPKSRSVRHPMFFTMPSNTITFVSDSGMILMLSESPGVDSLVGSLHANSINLPFPECRINDILHYVFTDTYLQPPSPARLLDLLGEEDL